MLAGCWDKLSIVFGLSFSCSDDGAFFYPDLVLKLVLKQCKCVSCSVHNTNAISHKVEAFTFAQHSSTLSHIVIPIDRQNNTIKREQVNQSCRLLDVSLLKSVIESNNTNNYANVLMVMEGCWTLLAKWV